MEDYPNPQNISPEGNRGSANLTFIFVVLIIIFAFLFTSGYKKNTQNYPSVTYNAPDTTSIDRSQKKSLQLKTFGFESVTRTNQCTDIPTNTEPEIFVGSDPAPGGSVGTGGKIRVWVTDERAPFIAPGELVDPASGTVTRAGDRTARGTIRHGRESFSYLFEPAIYLTPITNSNINGPYAGDAENNGIPNFPSIIKGQYNNNPAGVGRGSSTTIPIDSDWINFLNGPDYVGRNTRRLRLLTYTAEYIWDVASFNLSPGSYRAQIIIWDGDNDLGMDCISIQL